MTADPLVTRFLLLNPHVALANVNDSDRPPTLHIWPKRDQAAYTFLLPPGLVDANRHLHRPPAPHDVP